MKSIIQFPHPGAEHTLDSGQVWNSSAHKRKYLKVNGSYLKDLSSMPIEEVVYFWGEWEAQSKLIQTIEDNNPNFPKNIFEAYYSLPIPPKGANTDPFVFGSKFYYCICKQGHYPTLRDLDKGSLIIFGSHKDVNFVIDTMFVVKGWKDYKINEIPSLKKEYNDAFYYASLEPIVNATKVHCKDMIEDKKTGICLPLICDDENDNNPVQDIKSYRIYEAVMYDDREAFNGIFSYAPCIPKPYGDNGFARPTINLSYISQELNQGLKIIRYEDVKKVWSEITQEILQHESLMIKTDLPKILNQLK